jgi:hypothetical protein
VIYALLSLAGLGVVAAAPYLNGPVRDYPGFLPWIRAGVEDASWTTLGGLAMAGLLGGFFQGRHPFRLGFSTILLLPVWAVIEMFLDPTSHNLWPLEFGIYAFWGAAASLGAKAGIFFKSRQNQP